MAYINRITDTKLSRTLQASGTLLIRGAKACGKTEFAKQFSKSILEVGTDPQVPLLMDTSPNRLLFGNSPRLIDEWQEQSDLCNFTRREIDNRAYIELLAETDIFKKGQTAQCIKLNPGFA